MTESLIWRQEVIFCSRETEGSISIICTIPGLQWGQCRLTTYAWWCSFRLRWGPTVQELHLKKQHLHFSYDEDCDWTSLTSFHNVLTKIPDIPLRTQKEMFFVATFLVLFREKPSRLPLCCFLRLLTTITGFYTDKTRWRQTARINLRSANTSWWLVGENVPSKNKSCKFRFSSSPLCNVYCFQSKTLK